MCTLDFLLHLSIAGLLHDIKSFLGLFKPIFGLLHVLKHMLGSFFELTGGRDLSRHELLLVRILLHSFDELVQIDRSSVQVLGHILQVELGLLFVQGLTVGDLVVEITPEPILLRTRVNRLLVDVHQLLNLLLILLLVFENHHTLSMHWIKHRVRSTWLHERLRYRSRWLWKQSIRGPPSCWRTENTIRSSGRVKETARWRLN